VAIGAGTAVGAVQALAGGRAEEPVVLPLGPGALALWSAADGLGAALARPDGRFAATAAPAGLPPSGHSASTNRDLATAGRWAIFAWSRQDDGVMRVSSRRF
jgi:hypothetical protein